MKRYRSSFCPQRSAGSRFGSLSFCLALFSAIGFLASCSAERTWDVRGRVVGFGDDPRTVFVSHENIPGLMPAMTMPFQTDDPETARGVRLGDAIQFRLHANADSSWISHVRPLPADAPALVLEEDDSSHIPPRPAQLSPGDPVPEVRLVDQQDESFTVDRYRGSYLLVNFIYTRCPLPDYCPWLTRRFAALAKAFASMDSADVAFLSVSIDPEYDTPAVLRDYVADQVDWSPGWTFATGNPDEIRRFATALGVEYTQSGDDLLHGLVTALIDPDGNLNTVWRGNDWQPEEVINRIAYLSATN